MQKQINQTTYGHIQSMDHIQAAVVDGQTHCRSCNDITPRHETFCSGDCIRLFFAEVQDKIYFPKMK